jgi:prophage regulatory protein
MGPQLAAELGVRTRGLQKFLRMAGVIAATGLGRATIYELMAAEKFPRPVKILGAGSKAVGWIESEVVEWQEARIAERDGAEAA